MQAVATRTNSPRRRPSTHVPWRIVSRVACSSDSYIMQLQRCSTQVVSGSDAQAVSGSEGMQLERAGGAGQEHDVQSLSRDTLQPCHTHDLSCFHVDIGLQLEDQRYIARPYTPLSSAAECVRGSFPHCFFVTF